ncbi:MAG: CGNR zinc finger domain-containing protein [Bacteroidales bacterium]|nr:MAG: CGNR zinc finger domain-containing protein [Bacteroidales bacterium]
MRPYKRTIETIPLDGGWLCLDFINTTGDRFKEPLKCYLPTNDDVLKWAKRLKLLSGKELSDIKVFNSEYPEAAEKAHKKVINIRETLYQLFSAIANDLPPSVSVLKKFNKYLSETFDNLKLVVDKNRVVKEDWQRDNNGMHQFQLHIIRSAYELLKSDLLLTLKECEKCGWLFLDRSKNKSRKWCSMEACGSSEKSKKYYRKMKKGQRP